MRTTSRTWLATFGVIAFILLVLVASCGKRSSSGPTSPTGSLNTAVMPGVMLTLPSTWVVQSGSDQTTASISNVRESEPLNEQSLQTEALLGLHTLQNANPRALAIEDWFNDYFTGGFPSDLLDKRSTTVAGRPAVRIELIEVGRRVHIYVPRGTDVLEITYGLYAPTFVGTYEAIIGSLQF